jgi:predicted transcriptional regulator
MTASVGPKPSYTEAMEVRLSPDEEARLAAIAKVVGSNPEQLVKDAALSLLDEDRRFREAVRAGIAQADRGEFVEEAEMDARVDRMFRS